jgi:hypothetical protein
LPKIHKRLENVPGRPVISNCGTATERVSELLDFHIQPLVEGVPSVIKDSTHFLQRLEDLGHIPSTAILCTMDVVGLYTYIPHSEGLEALRLAMNKAEKDLPVDDLISLANWFWKIIFLNLMRICYDKNWERLLGQNLRQVLQICLWGISRNVF